MPVVDTSDATIETAYPNPELKVAALMKHLTEKDNIMSDMKKDMKR